MNQKKEIDIVYTWVNNYDTSWLKNKTEYLNKTNKKVIPNNSIGNERFEDHDELKYSLRSIEKYIPWVRYIYIITDKQKPSWIDYNNKRIHIIDHSEIFPSYIKKPVYNSLLIEWYIHNIPELSENFIYLNDDFFILKKLKKTDFFVNDCPVSYITALQKLDREILIPSKFNSRTFFKDFSDYLDSLPLRKLNWYENTVDMIAAQYNNNYGCYWVKHVPLAFKKSVLKELLNIYQPYVKRYMADKHFRSKYDIAIQWLYIPYLLERKGLKINTDNVLYEYDFGFSNINQKKLELLKITHDDNYLFLNINQNGKLTRNLINSTVKALSLHFPKKSIFEKNYINS